MSMVIPTLKWALNSPTVIYSAEPDLSNWVTRVQGQSSDVTGSGVQTAVGAFIVGLKTDGLWNLGQRIGVYAGNDLNALKAPLVNVSGSVTDTLTGFVSSDYTVNGLVGGSGKSLRTGFVGDGANGIGAGGINDFSMAVYVRDTNYGSGMQMGTQTSADATRGCYLYHDASNANAEMWNISNGITIADAGGIGFYIGSRIASNDLRLYKNGSQIGSTATNPAGQTNAFQIYVHDGDLSNAANWAPSGQRFCLYWIGKGLTSTQAANLYTRVQTLQTSLGRQV